MQELMLNVHHIVLKTMADGGALVCVEKVQGCMVLVHDARPATRL